MSVVPLPVRACPALGSLVTKGPGIRRAAPGQPSSCRHAWREWLAGRPASVKFGYPGCPGQFRYLGDSAGGVLAAGASPGVGERAELTGPVVPDRVDPAIPTNEQRDDEVPGASVVNDAAVAAYRLSVQAGNPLSERRLAQMFGRASRRWARARIADARQASSIEESPGALAMAAPVRHG